MAVPLLQTTCYLHVSAVVGSFRGLKRDGTEYTPSSNERRSSAVQKTRAVWVLSMRRIFLADKVTDTTVNIMLASVARPITFSLQMVTVERQQHESKRVEVYFNHFQSKLLS